jgi:hypothetical protein
MAYAFPSAGALDFATCTYGGSRLTFRGPKRDTERAFVSVIGGSDAYGKFVRAPFPDLLERTLGLPVANLGQQNAGIDVFLNDPTTLEIAAKSSVAVIQLLGPQNNSNRFYAVHPRRNDRFLAAKPALRELFPKVDFTEFNFTRHLLLTLQHQSPEKFQILATELRQVWTLHMRHLLAQLPCPKLLVWISETAPVAAQDADDLFANPMLIDREMIAGIARLATQVVQAIPSPEARVMGLEGMDFAPQDLPSAAASLGPYAHREICDTLHPIIEEQLRPRH